MKVLNFQGAQLLVVQFSYNFVFNVLHLTTFFSVFHAKIIESPDVA